MFSKTVSISHLALRIARAILTGTLLVGAISQAQPFPDRPIRVLVPYPAGGAADTLVRLLAAGAKEHLGQQLVIDNKPGANGILGMEQTARAPADGYTIVLGAIGPLSVSPFIQKVGFDPVKDFVPIAFLATVPNVLVVKSESPVKSVADLVALAKRRPGELNYGSAGPGSSNQLASELFNIEAGVKTVHVPYKGGAPAEMDLIGGQLSFIFDNLPSAIPHIQSGAMRALAVTSPNRQSILPEVPTMVEAGFPRFEAGSWFGLLAPAGTPRPVVDTLNRAFNASLAEPAIKEALLRRGFDLNPGSPEQFASFIQAESKKWQAVVKTANIVAQ